MTCLASCPIRRRDERVEAGMRAAARDCSGRRAQCLRSALMSSSDPGTANDASPPGDAELLRRYIAGEFVAFERLYDAHDRHCFGFIRRMLAGADEATAEDLHQEVWLAVARQAASFDESKARFVTWLFTIARHKVMDHFRKATGVVRLAGDLGEHGMAALDDLPDAPELSPERVVQNKQLAAALLREVQALPFAQRETFILFAHHELSLEAVAEITKVGLETAKSRLRYARQTLRQRLSHWKAEHA
jgi:RNA polymerase sigma-70 factor (ECF subfamily)